MTKWLIYDNDYWKGKQSIMEAVMSSGRRRTLARLTRKIDMYHPIFNVI
jgi:hypothetical protein